MRPDKKVPMVRARADHRKPNFLGSFSDRRRAGKAAITRQCYLSPALCRSSEMPVNRATRSSPIVNTIATIATAIPAAIRPYSMAVAPD